MSAPEAETKEAKEAKEVKEVNEAIEAKEAKAKEKTMVAQEICDFYDNIINQVDRARELFTNNALNIIKHCKQARDKDVEMFPNRDFWVAQRGSIDFNSRFDITLDHPTSKLDMSFDSLKTIQDEMSELFDVYEHTESEKDYDPSKYNHTILGYCNEDTLENFFHDKVTDTKDIKSGVAILLNEKYPFCSAVGLDDLYGLDADLKNQIKSCGGTGRIEPIKITTIQCYEYGIAGYIDLQVVCLSYYIE